MVLLLFLSVVSVVCFLFLFCGGTNVSCLRSGGCACDADDTEVVALIDDDVAGVSDISSDSDDDIDADDADEDDCDVIVDVV